MPLQLLHPPAERSYFGVRLTFLLSIALTAAIFAIYWQSFSFDYIHYDDPEYVFANDRVKQGLSLENLQWAFTTTTFSNWHPLTWISYMIDVQLYGKNPGGFHFTNVLLHVVNSVLLLLLFHKMSGQIVPSALIAAFFALHPLHVQSVAWIAERKDLLSGLFFLLTLFAYNKYACTGKISYYLLTLLCFVLGLMSKPMVVTLPFILLLLDFWPLQRFFSIRPPLISDDSVSLIPTRSTTFLILEKSPFLFLSFLSAWVTMYAQASGGSVASLTELSFFVRLENAIVSYFVYIVKMVWPFKYSIIYPHPWKTLQFWLIILSFATIAALTVSAFILRRKMPYFLVGWLWFLGMLVPVIGIIQVGMQAMADRYTYLPLIGLFIFVSWALFDIPLRKKNKTIFLFIVCMPLLIFLSLRSWQELGYWENGIRLFTRAIETTTNNFIAHNNLGYELVQKSRFSDAKKEFERSLEIDPTFFIAHLNLGRSLIEEKNYELGIKHYIKAIELKPNYTEAYVNLGNIYLKIGKNHEAAGYYVRALQLDPTLADIYNNLGAILSNDGKVEEAIKMFQMALAVKPDFPEAKSNILKSMILQKEVNNVKKND